MADYDARADRLARLTGPEADAAALTVLDELASEGIHLAPIGPVYNALARGEIAPLTVPAFNVRGLVYDIARAIYRRMAQRDALAVMFELAPSEAATGHQTFAQYAALVALAAAREGHRGPVFVQGDHFSLEEDSKEARQDLAAAARKLMAAGFRQIDLDAAALATDGETAAARQLPNAVATAALLQMLAGDAPDGMIFGGEVGEIGGQNTTPEELDVFVDLVRRHAGDAARLFGKVSVQTGTRHGGMTGADGAVARMPLDLDLARQLAEAARDKGFGGVIQHGASTLQPDQFAALPDAGIIEVHLATNIQNLVFDSPHFPAELRERMMRDALASSAGAAERGAETGAADAAQAFRQKRWSMWGPYKRELLDLPAEVRTQLAEGVADWAEGLLVAFRQPGRGAELGRLYR